MEMSLNLFSQNTRNRNQLNTLFHKLSNLFSDAKMRAKNWHREILIVNTLPLSCRMLFFTIPIPNTREGK